MNSTNSLNLNQSSMMLKHFAFGPGSDRECYILHSTIEENRRVLTVRTQYVLRNATGLGCHVRVFYKEKGKDQVVDLIAQKLLPGARLALPDHQDKEI